MELVRRAIDWARAQRVPALPSTAVPGTSELERRSLAAIGGIAARLAGPRYESWPRSLCDWAAAAPEPPPSLVDGIRRELAGGHDVLALLYEGLVSGQNRRRLGTFFTPSAV